MTRHLLARSTLALAVFVLSCATTPAPVPAEAAPPPPTLLAEETHLADLKQLTFAGENAEAYWSFDGQGVSLQRRTDLAGCDRIYTMKLFENGWLLKRPEPVPLSSGKGATTCAHYFPDGDVLFASTHLGGDACPPKPDMSLGYVWALYDTYDIFSAKPDGSGLTRLTDAPGYDAEATVCGKDGSIVFTSVRDQDVELYRMDKDGKNVKRLTFEPGYDGGAFFNKDCTKLVWRASRPTGEALDEYKALLAKGLVRPSKLELYVGNADGSEAHQVTYLNSASFAPFWFPDRERILFSSNYGDPKGREFDIWAVNADGTELERITHTRGFDGFPMFSPDGKWLIFSSNRMTAPGQNDTNMFVARWVNGSVKPHVTGAAERIKADVAWLADPAREGRGVGTEGIVAAAEYIEQRLKELGLEPLGENGGWRVPFQVTTKVTVGAATKLKLAGKDVAAADFAPLGWSGQGAVKGQALLAGYAVQDAELGLNDFKGLDVKGKVVIARRFVPDNEKLATPEAQRRAGDLRKKAFIAKSLGAKALIVVDWPVLPPVKPEVKDAKAEPKPAEPKPATKADPHAQQGRPTLPPEAPFPGLRPEGTGDSGLPVLLVKRAALEPLWKKLEAKGRVDVELQVALEFEKTTAFNVVGRIPAKSRVADGPVIIGAHYDHLGMGGPTSLAPDKVVPHVGADDNGSGTATVLEVARVLSERRDTLPRDVVIIAFSGEEEGVLGSSAIVAAKPAWLTGATAMLNLDMVGRLRMNSMNVLGSDSATEWMGLVQASCAKLRVACKASGDGYGPGDQMAFYSAGLPVLHFFTGAHSDYHKPSDTFDKLNDSGMAKIAEVVADLAVSSAQAKLTYQKVATPPGKGDARNFNASLGTVPDYGGPPPGIKGVLLSDVRPGGGAEKAGMRRGDVIVKLGKYDVRSVDDLMFVLMQAKPGETITALVLRDGKELALETTFQEGRRR